VSAFRPVSAAILAILLSTASACHTHPRVPDLATLSQQLVPSGKGSVVIMDIMDCNLGTDDIATLNLLRVNSRTIGVVVAPPDSGVDRTQLTSALGPSFPLTDDNGDWQRAVANEGLSLPVVLVIIDGVVVRRESGARAYELAGSERLSSSR